MKDFHLDHTMMSMLGDFHPTGHLVVMVPTREDACRAEALLARDGQDCGKVCLLTPEDVLAIVRQFDGRDLQLPSVGFEEDAARHFAELARQGHHALLVPARHARDGEHIVAALRGVGISCAVHYRHFVIEELVE